MRILVIDNETIHLEKLEHLLRGHEHQVVEWSDLTQTVITDFDCYILSGSSQFPVLFNLEKLDPQLEPVRQSSKPILGICLGFQLIIQAFGGELELYPQPIKGHFKLSVQQADPLFNNTDQITVFESHRWGAKLIPPQLAVLARNQEGMVEVVKDKQKMIYSFLFHPEVTTDNNGSKLLTNFLTLVEAKL